MRDLANSIAVVESLAPAVRTTDANGTGVDLQGFQSATVIAHIGAEGDTLASDLKIDLKLEHSDDDQTFTAVAQADVVEATIADGGIFYTADAAADVGVATVGYVGGKRYVRVVSDLTGTHTNGTPTSAVVVKGHPRHSTDA